MDHFGVADVAPETLAALERLEQRVAALERALAEAHLPAEAAPRPPAAAPLRPASDWNASTIVSLTGRTLMVLGGAYLLRALSEGGVLQPAAGVAAGFAYALLWCTLCWRAPSKPSATFHGLTVTLVAYPLLWETITRFALIPPAGGAIALAVIAAALLVAARIRQLEVVAWFAALGATATAVALAVSTTTFVPYTIVVALVGTAALWLGYVDGWVGIRWPVAFVADVMVLLITFRAVSPNVGDVRTETLTLQFIVLALYLGSFVARTLVLGREVIPFEVMQSAAAMSVCFGGALAVVAAAQQSATPLGALALTVGIAAYAFSFVYVEPRKLWRNLTFFTSHAVAFVLAGIVILLPLTGVTLAAAALALVCSEWARRSGRLTLAFHALVFAAACAWASGLAGAALSAFAGPAASSWRIDLWMLLALAVVAACTAWPLPSAVRRLATPAARTLRLTRMSVLAWLAAGVGVLLVVPLLTGRSDAAADPGVVAAARTVVLVLTAGAIVFWPRDIPRPEYAWLTYGLLAWIGLKLLFEDIPRGRPATLFVALAVYGAALIVLPRAARRGQGVKP